MSWIRSPEARAFLIHAGAWAVVCAGLAAWNLMQVPPEGQPVKYWFQWPLFGWGIGVAAHGLGLWLRDRDDNPPLLASEERRGFWVHLFVYVAVSALLVWVDLSTPPGLDWVWWPVLGWGAGVAAHAWGVFHGGGEGREETGRSASAPEPQRVVAQSAVVAAARQSAASSGARKKTGSKPPGAKKPSGSKKTSGARKTAGAAKSRSAKRTAPRTGGRSSGSTRARSSRRR
ncbi:MAG: 2TM domain-containing protein [Hyphomicrobiales bacterium]